MDLIQGSAWNPQHELPLAQFLFLSAVSDKEDFLFYGYSSFYLHSLFMAEELKYGLIFLLFHNSPFSYSFIWSGDNDLQQPFPNLFLQ